MWVHYKIPTSIIPFYIAMRLRLFVQLLRACCVYVTFTAFANKLRKTAKELLFGATGRLEKIGVAIRKDLWAHQKK